MSERPPLVLLPGTLCTEQTFRHQVAHLADLADPRVLVLTEGETAQESARWILRRAPERFALVGFSQGGVVAFEIMRWAPERVTKLCLMSTNPNAPTQAQLETWRRWSEAALAERWGEVVVDFLAGLHPARACDPWLGRAIEEMAERTGKETFLKQLKVLTSRIDSRPYLPQIACPTLLLVGRQDPLTPVALHEEMAGLIPGSVLVPIEESGHYSPMERPQAVTAALRYWLAAGN